MFSKSWCEKVGITINRYNFKGRYMYESWSNLPDTHQSLVVLNFNWICVRVQLVKYCKFIVFIKMGDIFSSLLIFLRFIEWKLNTLRLRNWTVLEALLIQVHFLSPMKEFLNFSASFSTSHLTKKNLLYHLQKFPIDFFFCFFTQILPFTDKNSYYT